MVRKGDETAEGEINRRIPLLREVKFSGRKERRKKRRNSFYKKKKERKV